MWYHLATIAPRPRLSIHIGKTARYVSILMNKKECLSLCEVQVWSNGVDVALGKPAKQSSTDYKGVASRAVDGNTDGNYDKGHVTHTSNGKNEWWMVDLQVEYKIDAVSIYNRTKTSPMVIDRLKNFFVITSSLPLLDLKDTLQFKDMLKNNQ